MTPVQIAADVDLTIRHWRARGVLAPDIARDLRRDGLRVPHDTWHCVREAMIARQRLCEFAEAQPTRRAA